MSAVAYKMAATCPPPPCGEGLGVGVAPDEAVRPTPLYARPRRQFWTTPTLTLPARGREAVHLALRNWRAALVAALALAGLILLGQGVYIHAKAALAQVLLERAFSQSLATGAPVKAWSWADTWPVARIEIPRLGQSSIALQGASGEALAFGPGHLDGSPQAGERGTAIYAAHRDTHFAFLKDVKVGDDIAVQRADGETFRFRVEGTRVVRWDQSGLDPHAAGKTLALVTCFPFDATTRGPLRFVVEAKLIVPSASAAAR